MLLKSKSGALLSNVIIVQTTALAPYAVNELKSTVYSRKKPTVKKTKTTAVIKPMIKPAIRPKKPNAINPSTTPPPTAANSSKNMAIAPSIGSKSKRTTKNKTNETATEVVKAALVTRLQYRLTITGKTIEPQSAPTKISMDKISSFKLAKTTPNSAATTMVKRPTHSIFNGSGLFLVICLP